MSDAPVRDVPVATFRIAGPTAALHAVAYGPAGAPTLVACHGLGEERKGAVRVLHELGRTLAAGGAGLIGFDYAGTGESPGSFDAVRWDGLVGDTVAVLRAAAARADGAALGLLGVRLGARVALGAAAAAPAPVAGVVHWEPVFDGGRWLRELARRSRFRGTGGAAAGSALADGAEDVDGYVFSAGLAGDLSGQGGALPPATGRQAVVQIGHRADPAPRLAQAGEALGAAVVCLRMQPFWLESDIVDGAALIEETCRLWREMATHEH
ncbi:MAG: serine aminopeptidase domain-containing protein [Planctomycetota bacterium]